MTNQSVTPGPDGQSPTTTSFKPKVEIGKSGLRRFGGRIDEEFDPNLRGLRGMRKYEEMRRNDPDVGAILMAIEMSLLSVDWYVEAVSEDAADVEAKDFLESCMSDMSHSWRAFIWDIVTMYTYGFVFFEIVYKLRAGTQPSNGEAESEFDDGKIGWRKLAIRNQETIVDGWTFDEQGGLTGVWQTPYPIGKRVFIPIDKALLIKTKPERGNPEGYSLLRNAYRPYYMKTNVEEIEVIATERDMTGIPIMRPPVGATEEDKEDALAVLERVRWDEQAGIYLPRMGNEDHQRWDFELVTAAGTPRQDSDKIISRHTMSIARSVLAQFLTLGQGRVGSYALSKSFVDLFQLALKGALDTIEETVNAYAVKRLFRLNDFQVKKLPQIKHARIGQREIGPFVDAIVKLAGLGMPITAQDFVFIRDELEMPSMEEDEVDDMIEEAEAEKERKELERLQMRPPVAGPGQPPTAQQRGNGNNRQPSKQPADNAKVNGQGDKRQTAARARDQKPQAAGEFWQQFTEG